MDPVIKQKWVAALRSGQYTQGIGQLRVHNKTTDAVSFCCLGVLCDLQGHEWTDENSVCGEPDWEIQEKVSIPPSAISLLINMNDEGAHNLPPTNKSFKEIADYIEANL